MLSKKNINERQRKSELQNKREHFSLRKLTVGMASVLLGFSFMQVNNQTAKADTVTGADSAVVNKQTAKQKEQTNLATYSGLRSFLRSEPEAPQPSQASQGSQAEASSSGTETSAAETSSASSSAGSEAVSSSASSSTSATSTEVDETHSAKVEAQDGIEPRTIITDVDGQCNWSYSSVSKTMTFVATGSGNTLSSTPVKTLASLKGIGPDAIKFIEFDQSGGAINLPSSCYQKFANLSGLKGMINVDELVASNVTSMSGMFANDPKLLKLDLRGWNVSQVRSMDGMFSNNYSYGITDSSKQSVMSSLNLHGWNISKVYTISRMFYNLPKLKVLDVENWTTNSSNSMSMDEVFKNDTALVTSKEGDLDNGLDLSSWQFKVNCSMYHAFEGLSSLKTLNIGGLNTSNVNSMEGLFYNDSKLSTIKGFANWDVSSVTDMSEMFQNDSNLKKIAGIESWNVKNVEKMIHMFDGAFASSSSLTDLTLNWNVTKVAGSEDQHRGPGSGYWYATAYTQNGMAYMFANTKNLATLNLSNWDVTNVYSMYHMFDGAISLTKITGIEGWNVGRIHHMEFMFNGDSSLKSLDLHNWHTSQVVNMSSIFNGDSKLTTLNLGKNDSGLQTFTTPVVGDDSNMFNGVGADNVASSPLKLTLGNFKISKSYAWGSFEGRSIESTEAITDVTTSSGSVNYITLDKLKDLYKDATNTNRPVENTYTVYLHKHDDERYGLTIPPDPNHSTNNIPTVYAHKGQKTQITNGTDLNGVNEILGLIFYDSEISPLGTHYSITDLNSKPDYFNSDPEHPENTPKTVTGVKWVSKKAMNSSGELIDGGVIETDHIYNDVDGSLNHIENKIIYNPTDTVANELGNAVVEVDFGEQRAKVDEHGNPVYVNKLNEYGDPVVDKSNGGPVYVNKVDEHGNLVHASAHIGKYIPVNIVLPNITTATQYAQKGKLPSEEKAKNAIAIDGSAAETWQDKWNLKYSWVIRKVDRNGRPIDANGHSLDAAGHPMDTDGHLLDADGHSLDADGHPMDSLGNPILSEYSQPTYSQPAYSPLTDNDVKHSDTNPYGKVPNVGVKISYSTPDVDDDGFEIQPVDLEVKNYADSYITTFKPSALNLLKAHFATNPDTHQPEIVDPSEFKDSTSWGQFLNVVTNDTFHTQQTGNLSDIIKSIEWDLGDSSAVPPRPSGAPTLTLGQQTTGRTLKITYTDGSTALVPNAAVTVYGGEVDSGNVTTVGINQTDMLSSDTAKAALTAASFTSINDNDSLATYSWSKDGVSSVNPDISQPVTPTAPNAYIIIDYHDNTAKQVIPVKLKVTALKQDYTPVNSSGISIHATDADDAFTGGHTRVPVITDPATIDQVLTLKDPSGLPLGSPVASSTKVRKIIWKTDDEPNSAGNATQNHQVIVVYNDGSESVPISATFNVESATIKGTATGISQSESNYSGTFLQGTVPAAKTLVNLPAHFADAQCKWVKNDATHTALPLEDLNNMDGKVDAAIAVTYADNTHQYLPIKLTVDTRSGISECRPVAQTIHPDQLLNIDDLVKITQKGTNDVVSHSEYQLAWKDNIAPDLTAASLGDAISKKIPGTIIVTFVGGSTMPVDVDITMVSAQKKQALATKQAYISNAGLELSDTQIKKIVSHYLDTSTIDSLPTDSQPTYMLAQTGNTVTLTVTYSDDGSQQTFTDIPLKLVKAQVNNNPIPVAQGSSLGTDVIKQALLNYGEVMATGADVDDQIAGVNSSQVGSRQYGSFKIKYSEDAAWGLPGATDTIPVTIDIVPAPERPVDNKPVLKPGSVSVPQYTDLTTHPEYAKTAVTNTNFMLDGYEYTWDPDSLPKTDQSGTYKTFVNVHAKDGTFVSVPVTVQVVAPSLDEAILMHNSYIYNQDANRVINRVLQRGLKVKTYGTTLIDGKLYYHLEDNQYVKAGNIDGQTRQMAKTAYIYNHAGKRVEDQVIYKGTKVKTYGAAVKINHDKYYTLGLEKFIKAETVR
ncbi:BspA family leucine-rich repeat surface protein [Lactobacillus sp. ESL0791]|uniref:BspA family leucine-rich repeat surface protein n=1 Tax=Lactobacillus sp. ESL0791 TaxID=2983234 RepID=UPI0023F97A2C|nr:BspA family leucine-rich repeat surface protein [Lactobacillus sp. ESL0791]MDF7639784.1 BspA family leucine-rich repeat surface protein [Lactobacillus sp. ESL0791]